MIQKAKYLSQDQKRTIAPGWLQKSWQSARQQGLDQITKEEIDPEIDAARKARREQQRPSEQ